MTDQRTHELVDECYRQVENCEYTGVGLYVWAKYAWWWRNTFVVLPIVLGGVASSKILAADQSGPQTLAAVLAFLASVFPAIYQALGMDLRVSEIRGSAAEFTNLRDRFRQAAKIKSHAPFDEFQAEFEALMDRMDSTRRTSPPVPEWCFRRGRDKIKNGHYLHDLDEKGRGV